MSFSGTPLGQGRRLDHSTFLGKPPSTGNSPPSPHRIIPASYSYGAPTLASRSPPKPSSPSRERTRSSHNQQDDSISTENEPALARFARLKQQQSITNPLSARPGGPKIITSPPTPSKWAVKDTSVNIASAFTQAANDMLPASNPNSAWVSGASRPNTVPRSTSVEYEQEARAAVSRRLGPPPNRLARNSNNNASTSSGTSTAKKPPVSKSVSIRSVPDSENEEDRSANNNNVRGKSPFEHVVEAASRVLKPATYYLLDRSGKDDSTANANGDSSNSYDYAAEEQAYQSSVRKSREGPTHKRNRMSTDNKAYKPTASDVESSDDDDDDRPRRKGGRKGPAGGPLHSLPVINQDKRKKKKATGKGKGSKSNIALNGEEEEEEEGLREGSGSDEQSQSRSQLHGLQPRLSPFPRGSAPAEHSLPSFSFSIEHDPSTSTEQGLNSIPELDEHELPSLQHEQQQQRQPQILPAPARRSRSRTPKPTYAPRPRFSIGVLLGNIVHGFRVLGAHTITLFFFVFGRIVGTLWDILVVRPGKWLGVQRGAGLAAGKYLVLGGALVLAWAALGAWDVRLPQVGMPTVNWGGGEKTVRYTAPDVPAGDVAELAERLLRIENALSGLVGDTERVRAKADEGVRGYGQLVGKLGELEGKIRGAGEVKGEVGGVRREVEVLREEMRVREREERERVKEWERERERGKEREKEREKEMGVGVGVDEEKIRLFEERLGSMEGNVREAVELGKKAISTVSTAPSTDTQSGSATAWWNKLASSSGSKSGLTIKSSDGQDVTALIQHLVDSAVSPLTKDTLAKPDYALNSGGAGVIPRLTSPTLEVKPESLPGQILGFVTGNGYAIGLPPVMALNPDINLGRCWPFAGGEGQLGVKLAAPVYISEISVDHVAKEVAFDMASAPRAMEVWGMVEGKDNVLKMQVWQEEKRAQRREAEERGEVLDEEEEYPASLPTYPPFVRLAQFSYDIHAPGNVQTFPVDPEIRALDVDFGIVVLRVLNNWGMDFTCLYRFRVHGTRIGGDVPLPILEDLL